MTMTRACFFIWMPSPPSRTFPSSCVPKRLAAVDPVDIHDARWWLREVMFHVELHAFIYEPVLLLLVFHRRRLPVVMVRLKMSETLTEAATYIEQGHVRVGPHAVTDPAVSAGLLKGISGRGNGVLGDLQ